MRGEQPSSAGAKDAPFSQREKVTREGWEEQPSPAGVEDAPLSQRERENGEKYVK